MGLLHRETQRSLRVGKPLGVIMADLDHFKHINDTYGHPVGDVVLGEVARRILGSVRNYDYVGRYGGEEFLIVLAECSPSDLAVSTERMRACVSKKPVETDAGAISVTLSIGSVAGNAVGAPVLNGEQLLRTADAALYCAKTNGRNRVECAPETNLASAAGAAQ